MIFLRTETTSKQLEELFSQHGTVQNVTIPVNKDTLEPRGFAFVDLASAEEVQSVIDNLHETEINGRAIRVTPSLQKTEAREQKNKTGKWLLTTT